MDEFDYQTTKKKIMARRALIRSLRKRKMITGDPSLRSISGSLYDRMTSALRDGFYSPGTMLRDFITWYRLAAPIYKDSALDPYRPDGWNDFLKGLLDIAQYPMENEGLWQPFIEKALENFKQELMLIG